MSQSSDFPADAGVVVAGGGLAAVSAVRGLRNAGWRGTVSIFTAENEPSYDRPPLSKQYLSGQLTDAEISLLREGEDESLDVIVHFDSPASGIDSVARRLLLESGESVSYDALVIATGAEVRRLALDDSLGGVHYLRTRVDSAGLRASVESGEYVVIVGAGFIGLEVAATLRAKGADVTVLEAAQGVLTRALGDHGGQQLLDMHISHGVNFVFGASVRAVLGAGRVGSVEYEVGGKLKTVRADTVLVAVGAQPSTGWLEGSAVEVDDGVVCDAGGRTSVNRVYAAGDVSRWPNAALGTHDRMEHWQSAMEQGTVVGANVAVELGVASSFKQEWVKVPYFWSDQFEHKIQFCGAPGKQWYSARTERGWAACSGNENGLLRGVLAIDNPPLLAKGRRHIASGMAWDEAVAWLDSM